MSPYLRIFIFLTLPLLLSIVSCGDSSIKYYNLGIEAAERNDIDEAISMWRKSLEYRPDDPDTRYNLGMALLEKKEYREAEQHFKEAASIESNDHQLQYGLGLSLESQGKLSEAKKAYRYSIDLKPNFTSPYARLAVIGLKQDQVNTAEKYAIEALRLSPRNRDASLVLAESYYRQSNYQAAYAQLISARSSFEEDPEYLLILGKVMNARHMHEDALATLLRAKSLGQKDSILFQHLGTASLELKDYDKAKEYFQLSLYRDSNNVEALIGLARTCYDMGDFEESVAAWVKARSHAPHNSEIEIGLAITYLRIRKFSEAAKILEGMSKTEDTPPMAWYYLGHAHMMQGLTDKAKESFNKFTQVWQGDPELIREVKEILVTLE
jgi:tetratricopeptide (TPR) repeat protein